MNPKIVVFLLALTTSSVFAAGPKASSCLRSQNAKECLADVAITSLAKERSPESRVSGIAALISSLAKAGVRRDVLLSAEEDEDTAPGNSRWSLAVSRRTYALSNGLNSDALESPQRLEVLAELLRKRGDGLDRLWIVWDACDAREGAAPEAVAKWDGTLDRLCALDQSDIEALEKTLPGISDSASALVESYNRDEAALKRSIAA
jgi:hypothetical protein